MFKTRAAPSSRPAPPPAGRWGFFVNERRAGERQWPPRLTASQLGGGRRFQRYALTATQPHRQPQQQRPCPPEDGTVVVVGGGPAGLGAALLLAKQGWRNIHILESKPTLEAEQPDKSYCYMIDGRGQRFLQAFGLLDLLAARSVPTDAMDITVVHHDGKVVDKRLNIKVGGRVSHWLPRRSFLQLLADDGVRRLYPDRITIHYGTTVTDISRYLDQYGRPQLRVTAAEAAAGTSTSDSGTDWAEVRRSYSSSSGRALGPYSHWPRLQRTFTPQLLVGADGINSVVRTQLQLWDDEDYAAAAAQRRGSGGAAGPSAAGDSMLSDMSADMGSGNCAQRRRRSDRGTTVGQPNLRLNRFAVHRFQSESAGLRFKVLQLPPNPVMTKGEGGRRVPNSHFAVAYSVPNPSIIRQPRPDIELRLGMLPVKDPSAPRTGNFIAVPDNRLWALETGLDLYPYLERHFPKVPFRELISVEEAERFVASQGGVFPYPQYCETFQYVLRDVPGAEPPPGTPAAAAKAAAAKRRGANPLQLFTQLLSAGKASAADASTAVRVVPPTDDAGATTPGVLLLGDAIHAFPPDIGQGVNSAMEDLTVLDGCLEAHGAGNVQAALPAFEAARKEDVKALIDIACFAYPQKYNQDPHRRLLWAINFGVRLLLSKLLPWLFAPPAMLLVQNSELRYSAIARRVHGTTRTLKALLAALAATVTWLLVNRSRMPVAA